MITKFLGDKQGSVAFIVIFMLIAIFVGALMYLSLNPAYQEIRTNTSNISGVNASHTYYQTPAFANPMDLIWKVGLIFIILLGVIWGVSNAEIQS